MTGNQIGIENGIIPKVGVKESSNPFFRLLQWHYSGKKYERSNDQIKRERTLLPGIPFNRWFCLPAAIIVQFCCGSLYTWSIYNKPIDILIYGENRNISPITFYISVGFFGGSAAIMGPWLERRGPRTACMLGATCLFLGNLIAALALYLKVIWLVFIGYGIVAGFGFGLSYISPISAIQKWFPDRRGLASGFATCGFGMGSIVISKLQIPLIHSVGLPLTFVVLGSSFFILMTICAQVLRIPPPDFTVDGIPVDQVQMSSKVTPKKEEPNIPSPLKFTSELSLIECITSRDFALMYAMVFCNVIFGLVLISRFSNLITDIFKKSADEAATVVAINGGVNLSGRLFFSIVSDYVGRKNCFVVMQTTQVIILGSFMSITTTRTYWAFLMTMWIVSACYGAVFGIIPAFLTDRFGPSNIGACHGVILTAWSIAGVGGGLIFSLVFNSLLNSGYSTDDPWPYNVNVWWIFCILTLGWFLLFFLSPTESDKRFWRKLKGMFKCWNRGRRIYVTETR